MSIQDEIHHAMQQAQRKLSNNQELSKEDLSLLLLTSLLEEEAENGAN